jgi:uridine kinase
MAQRDGTDPDPAAASNERYRVGQEMYVERVNPVALAAVRIDNSDPANPKVIR